MSIGQYKTGLGYDIHRFAQGRKLFLGGVEVAYELGLEGHSDADVVLHAVCDALLGAVGKGDIGDHFPNTDAQYKDISSLVLLERVYDIVKEEGYGVGNLDIMIQAEVPNVKQYKPQMRVCIAKKLHIEESHVNIKATTQEGLGAIGNKEGIAAFATVLLEKE
ncbi:2-C-methyl-D-erythritol 2,4-cyclodiphosphate synthase [hydrothermal vent metagenome]|uniref:2-C-methyl-D-erythritol 2,4-cyclodiphosphate synthase n=1 Tax=hydrothermal vent metagenome TaxID=652676 RepID=A0A3B1CXA3_9ZZZZ